MKGTRYVVREKLQQELEDEMRLLWRWMHVRRKLADKGGPMGDFYCRSAAECETVLRTLIGIRDEATVKLRPQKEGGA